ncbi:hypothetical protein COMA2_130040 [Candidatus Nitrospira nitrificans]|uniref:Uncharacterized protein n=1 Tax=Candidatus Nitrospira nitrificans TaxID=1742973 RepID=A0A0S4L6Q1_9BACT|nr:hypothetical protein COMA2_130040 [Candidatus Nitrospira nitrificans]
MSVKISSLSADDQRLMTACARRVIIGGGDLFDNPGSSYYNEPIFTNELGFAKPYTQFFHNCSHRSRQINPR